MDKKDLVLEIIKNRIENHRSDVENCKSLAKKYNDSEYYSFERRHNTCINELLLLMQEIESKL